MPKKINIIDYIILEIIRLLLAYKKKKIHLEERFKDRLYESTLISALFFYTLKYNNNYKKNPMLLHPNTGYNIHKQWA